MNKKNMFVLAVVIIISMIMGGLGWPLPNQKVKSPVYL